MSWYRTYRPTAVSGLHLTQVRTQLENLIKRGQIPQVWLLTGPKGTGKTSTARIMAAMLNLPANEPIVQHLFFQAKAPKSLVLQDPDPTDADQQKILQGQSYVVQEWDAASHRGIDDVRSLKEQVGLPPAVGLMSVYILDEVHMLTTEAFNALLKLLEEPPRHVVFMLATTERHKVPDTIISRATTVQFAQATDTEIVAALQTILDQEKMTAEEGVLAVIARAAGGSFRDAVKLLEQVGSGEKEVRMEQVANLGSALDQEIATLMQGVIAKDAQVVVNTFAAWRSVNHQPDFVYRQVLTWLHRQILIALQVEQGEASVAQAAALFLLQELQVLPGWNTTPIPLLPLEVKLLDIIQRAQQRKAKSGGDQTPPAPSSTSKPEKAAPRTPSVAEAAVSAADTLDTEPQIIVNTILAADPSPTDTVTNVAPVALGTAKILLEQWDNFVDLVAEKNTTIAAVLRSAKPLETHAEEAKIAVFYRFHYEQLQQPRFQKIFQESAEPLTGGLTKLEFILQEGGSSHATDQVPSLTALAEQVLV